MTTKLLTIIACIVFFTAKAFSQQFEVPNATLNTKEDYVKYEKEVIAAVNWLETTPLGNEDDKRKLASAFVLQWITGSPTVTVSVGGDLLLKTTKKNPELLILFMGAYTRYSLQNNYDTSRVNGYIAGAKSMVALYKLGGKVKKDKVMDEMVKAVDDGKLEDYVKEKLMK